MTSLSYTSVLNDMATGAIDFDTDSFKVMLVTSSYVPSAAHTKRSDITNEIAPSGAYVAGGLSATCNATVDNTNDRIEIALGGAAATTVTATARGAVYYKARGGASSADELVAYIDFGDDIVSEGGTFAINDSKIWLLNAETFGVYTSALEEMATGTVDFDTDTFKCMLVTSAYTFNKDSHSRRSDIGNEVATGGDYAAGGPVIAVTVVKSDSNDRVDIVFAGFSLATTAFANVRGAVFYKSRGGLASADEVIAYVNFGTNIGGGAFSLTDSKIRMTVPLAITSITPAFGSDIGGTAITIHGTNLGGATAVSIGGVPCTSVVAVDANTVTAVTGPHAAGAVTATVTAENGTITGGTFTYYTSGATTYDSSAGNHTVTRYTTLTVEGWSGGGSSAVTAGGSSTSGIIGAVSSVATLGLSATPGARGGTPPVIANTPGVGSGGNAENATGTAGSLSGGVSTGGGAPHGGGNVTNGAPGAPGVDGTVPGGGGASNNDGGATVCGGAGGGYFKSVYTYGDPGAPVVGDVLAYVVGNGGAATTLSGRTGGNGAHGRVKFTVA